MINSDQIHEHMEVVGSDGKHVGIVEKLVIKLMKSDPAAGGVHHILDLAASAKVHDGKLFLNQPACEIRHILRPVTAIPSRLDHATPSGCVGTK